MDKRLRELCGGLLDASSVRASPADAVDALVAVVKESARHLLAAALDAEFRHVHQRAAPKGAIDGDRPRRVVRNGYHPERRIVTGIGTVPVRMPKLRGRNGTKAAFRSALVPRYARRARPLDAESTALYLEAIATGEVHLALAALVGPPALALPPPVTRELARWWLERCKAWRDGPLPPCGNAPEPGGEAGAAPVAPHAYTKIDCARSPFDSLLQTRPFGEGD